MMMEECEVRSCDKNRSEFPAVDTPLNNHHPGPEITRFVRGFKLLALRR